MIKKITFKELKNLYQSKETSDLRKMFYDQMQFEDIISNHVCVAVIGDYDVDGITSTLIMTKALQKTGHAVLPIIPNRYLDGYGMKKNHVDMARSFGATLIITVDNGITQVDEVAYAKSLGMDVIITDHHKLPDVLPEADLIINPHIEGSHNLDTEDICGAMVAFLLCRYVVEDIAFVSEMSELAGLATIADSMPLVHENRFAVQHLLDRMNGNKTVNYGIRLLHQKLDDANAPVDVSTLQFGMIPFANAYGRMSSERENLFLKFMETKVLTDCEELFDLILETNNRRKSLTKTFAKDLASQVKTRDNVVVESVDDCPSGIIGLVASEAVKQFKVSAWIFTEFVDTNGKTMYKASARSASPDFSVYDNFKEMCMHHPDIFKDVKFGGHAGAMGVTLTPEQFEAFKKFKNEMPRVEVPEEVAYDVTDATDKEIFDYFKSIGYFDVEMPLFAKAETIISCGNFADKHTIFSTKPTSESEQKYMYFNELLDRKKVWNKTFQIYYVLNKKSDIEYSRFVRDLIPR